MTGHDNPRQDTRAKGVPGCHSLLSGLSTRFILSGGSNSSEISNLPHFNVTVKLETEFLSHWLEHLKNQSIAALRADSR